jgi:hypothetical protein
MPRTKLQEVLVEAPDGGYYRVPVTLASDGMTGTASIPGMGKVTVCKEFYQFPEPHMSFAWKIRQGRPDATH